LRETAEKLGCGPEDVVAASARIVAECDANFTALRGLQERFAGAEAALAMQSITPGAGGLRIISRVLEAVPADYLGFFATAFVKSEKAIALLAAAEGGHLLFAQHSSAGKDMNTLLKEMLEKVGGKGGGTRDFARGRLNDATQAERALSLAKEMLAAG